jgi:hypothetical protein
MNKLAKKYTPALEKGVQPIEESIEGHTVETAEVVAEKADSDDSPSEFVRIEMKLKGNDTIVKHWSSFPHLLALGLFTQDDDRAITFVPGRMIKGVYTAI